MIRRAAILIALSLPCVAPAESLPDQLAPLARVQDAVVKVYGLGGVAGLEGYQSGLFIEGESPRVITVDSPVLDGRSVTLIDALGDRCEGQVLGRDPMTGLALIGCPDSALPPSAIDLTAPAPPRRGLPVWALSNAFAIAIGNEPVTVQRGRVAAVAPMPLPIASVGGVRRPAIGAPSPGTRVVLLDAVTSNPGAGGGVVVDDRGTVVGLLGAECRSPITGAWINYALPTPAVRDAVARIQQQGDTASQSTPRGVASSRAVLRQIGLTLIPSITPRAPAFIEQVASNGPAAEAGCRADDLVVAVRGVTIGTAESAASAIATAFRDSDRVELTLLRGREIVNLTIRRAAP